MKKFLFAIIIVAIPYFALFSCSKSKNTVSSVESIEVIEDSNIFEAPNSTEKVLNTQASAVCRSLQYCSISRDCLVRILERQDDWVKVQIVSPEWLSDTHIGWVKASCIASEEGEKPSIVVEEGKDYEILLKDTSKTVICYYIKNITCELNDSNLYLFAKAIQDNLGGGCNVYIYESDKVKHLMTKYPLKGKEYIEVADEFAYLLDCQGFYSFYPYQDWQYKEYGGKNWKGKPIE